MNHAISQNTKSNSIRAKLDDSKVDKHQKRDIKGRVNIISAKQRMPRFSSEQMKERYVFTVPTLWHKVDEQVMKKQNSKITLAKVKEPKKVKMIDEPSVRIEM